MKAKLYLPDYQGKSILNLMASIENAFGGKSKYKSLKYSLDLKKKNVVLIVLDGMGYEFLMKHGKGSFLGDQIKARLTSVFPATTSAAIPMFLTGEPAEKHGLLAWYLFVKELGTVIIPLRFALRINEKQLDKEVEIEKIFNIHPLSNRIKRKMYIINPRNFSKIAFNSVVAGRGKCVWYNYGKILDFFNKIKKIIKSDKEKKFIYAYYNKLDNLTHEYGSSHSKVLNNFRKIDREIKKLVKAIKGTDTTLIITADHGLYDIKKNNVIDVAKYPKLAECLSVPLCGEARLAYAYVKPEKIRQFEKYCKTKMKKYFYLYKNKEFVKKFKLFEMNERFLSRIGDYVLVVKEPYRLDDYLINSEPSKHLGVHGGFSKEEMFVPLIVVETR